MVPRLRRELDRASGRRPPAAVLETVGEAAVARPVGCKTTTCRAFATVAGRAAVAAAFPSGATPAVVSPSSARVPLSGAVSAAAAVCAVTAAGAGGPVGCAARGGKSVSGSK